jgi:hypothetical protein
LSEAIGGSAAPPRGAIRWRILAATLAAFHVAYVVFVLFGALLVLAWPPAIWIHLASVLWAAGTMLGNLGCPVTTWEKEALRRSGKDPYAEGFLQHHVLRRTFSPGNERRNHILLGILAIGLNVGIYALILG